MKVVQIPERNAEETFTVEVGYKSGSTDVLKGTKGVDFDFTHTAYAVIDENENCLVLQHDAINSLRIVKE
jgi:hypothetical protein